MSTMLYKCIQTKREIAIIMSFLNSRNRRAYLDKADHILYSLLEWYNAFPIYKKAILMFMVAVGTVSLLLMIIFYDNFLELIVWVSKSIRDSPYGGLIIWLLVILVSFPPMIGLASLCNLTGMAFGVSFKGYFIIMSSTAVGSLLSFLLFRYLLKERAAKLLKTSRLFSAVSTVLGQDKDKFLILCLLQLCPRPYSITNAAFASIPNLSPLSFVLSGIIASPKYVLLLYIGSKLEHMGESKDFRTRIIDFISMSAAGLVSVVTGWLIYRKTKQILAEMGGGVILEDPEYEANTALLAEEEENFDV